jgi:hypothetical protein
LAQKTGEDEPIRLWKEAITAFRQAQDTKYVGRACLERYADGLPVTPQEKLAALKALGEGLQLLLHGRDLVRQAEVLVQTLLRLMLDGEA